jgi:hypothetical protein
VRNRASGGSARFSGFPKGDGSSPRLCSAQQLGRRRASSQLGVHGCASRFACP